MQKIAIKLCGLRTAALLEEAIALGCDYAGLVHYPASPRHVSVEEAAALAAHARGRIKTVIVTVDADDMQLAHLAREAQPDFFQLHGNETPERCREIRKKFAVPLIRAVKVQDSDDVARAGAYADVVEMLLFDAKAPKYALPGGNGLAFDWHLLAGRALALPWFLSGGISAANVSQAVRLSGARAVDVSSSVEAAPGVKDVNLMREFVQAVRQTETIL